MQPGTPSHTALRVALRRAAHQLYDRPLVLDDPVGLALLQPGFAAELRRTPARPSSVTLRAHLVARSRFAEDALLRAVEQGVRQYILLGAGLDTFAYRNNNADLRVFEVDHPATQGWKRELLAQAGVTIPETVVYVPVDFERDVFEERLRAAGFDWSAPAFVSWLGVVPYLSLRAFRATVRTLAQLAPGSGVALDYGQPRSVLPPLEQLEHDSLAERVSRIGEPFQLALTPQMMAAELSAFGGLEDVGAEEINARYFRDRSDHLRMRGQAGRLLTAWILRVEPSAAPGGGALPSNESASR